MILDRASQPLRGQGELLRIRQAEGRTIVTYKGPAHVSSHKSREEIEIGTGDHQQTMLLFDRLGYRPVFRYEKYRSVFARLGDPGVVTVDETPIGDFLEIEGPPEWIDAAARKLGFEPAQYITASYGRLYLEWAKQQGIEPANMVFDSVNRQLAP